jgi:endoglucanase
MIRRTWPSLVLATVLAWLAAPSFAATLQTQTLMRGAMSSTSFSAADFTAFGRYKGNLMRWQIMRNWGGVDTERDLVKWNAWFESKLTELDQVLVAAKANGFKIIIDMHTPPGGRHTDRSMAMFYEQVYNDRFLAAWQEVAVRYEGNDAVWAYDLVNEPSQSSVTPPAGLDSHTTQLKAANAIRAIDPTTPIIYEPYNIGPQYGTDEWSYGRGVVPLPLPNILYEVHPYSYRYLNNCYPGTMTDKIIYNKTYEQSHFLQQVRTWQLANGSPKIFVGEFSIPVSQKQCGAVQYLKDQIDIFESFGWDWTYHAFREAPDWSLEASDGRKPMLLSYFALNTNPYGTPSSPRHTRRLGRTK